MKRFSKKFIWALKYHIHPKFGHDKDFSQKKGSSTSMYSFNTYFTQKIGKSPKVILRKQCLRWADEQNWIHRTLWKSQEFTTTYSCITNVCELTILARKNVTFHMLCINHMETNRLTCFKKPTFICYHMLPILDVEKLKTNV